MRLFLLAIFLSALGLATFYLDGDPGNPNATSRVLPVITFFEEGTLQIDKYQELTIDKSKVGDHYYSDKAPLPTLLLIPVYGTLKVLGIAGNHESLNREPVYWLGGFLFGSLPMALFITLLVHQLIKQQDRFSPVFLAFLPVFGSFLFIFAGTFFSHWLAALLLLGAYLSIQQKKWILAGLLAGLAFMSEYPIGIALPIWAILIYLKEKDFQPVVRYVLGFAPALIGIMHYNYLITGSPFQFLYAYVAAADFVDPNGLIGFSYPHPKAIWDLIFSQYRGLLFYLPVLGLIVFIWIRNFNSSWKKVSHHYLFWIVVIYFLIICSHRMWWGGWSYGPRHLIPLAVLLLWEGTLFLSRQSFPKWIFWVASLMGLGCAWMAKITVAYAVPTEEMHPVTEYIFAKKYLNNIFNEQNLISHLGGSAQTAAWLWLGLLLSCVIALHLYYQKIKPENNYEPS